MLRENDRFRFRDIHRKFKQLAVLHYVVHKQLQLCWATGYYRGVIRISNIVVARAIDSNTIG